MLHAIIAENQQKFIQLFINRVMDHITLSDFQDLCSDTCKSEKFQNSHFEFSIDS